MFAGKIALGSRPCSIFFFFFLISCWTSVESFHMLQSKNKTWKKNRIGPAQGWYCIEGGSKNCKLLLWSLPLSALMMQRMQRSTIRHTVVCRRAARKMNILIFFVSTFGPYIASGKWASTRIAWLPKHRHQTVEPLRRLLSARARQLQQRNTIRLDYVQS